MSENKDGLSVAAPPPQETDGILAAPGDEEAPEWLKELMPDEVGLAPAAPIPTAGKAETMAVDEGELQDWLRSPVAPAGPDASQQVIEGTAVAVPSLNVDVEPPEAPVAPGGDGGKGPGEGGAKIEPKLKKSSEALEKEKSFLNEFKLAHEISAQAAACAERPWPESVEAIKGRRELAAASLSSMKETMNGVGLAPGDELQVKMQREKSARTYLELQTTIDGLNVAGLEKRALATMSEVQRLKTETLEVYAQVDIESVKVAEELKAWTRAEKTARANGLPEEGLTVFQLQRQNAENRLTAIKAKAGYLFLETSEKNVEAEQAEVNFKAAQVNIQRLEAEKAQARLAAENWQKKLVDPERQLAGMRQQAAGLEREVAGLDNILRAENIYTEVSKVADAFNQLNPGFIHQGGVEADLLQSMREGFPGTQVERDYIFTLAEQPEYADMTIPQLQQVFRDRVGKMNRILELEAAGAPEDMVRKLLTDPNYPDFPASFRSAVESTLRGRSFLAELPPGSDPVLSRANRAQRKVYTDIMLTLGLNPQTPEASEAQNASLVERARSGAVAKQMAELYAGESLPPELQDAGAEYGTEAWEIWKENVMKWSRDKVYQQQLDNYADPKLAAVAEEISLANNKYEADLEEERRQGGERVAGLGQQLQVAQAEAEAERQRVEALEPVVREVDRQIYVAVNAVPGAIWNLIPDTERQGFSLDLQPGETLEERRAKIQAAAEKALVAGTGLEGKEGDAAHQAGVAEVLGATKDYYAGKSTAEQAADRMKKWRSKKVGGVGGVGGREKTSAELQAASLQVAGAEMEQMRRARNLSRDQAENIAGKASALNTVLEGSGVLAAGAGGLLDAGFKLALESMFSTGGR